MLNKDEIKESLLNRNYKVIHVIKCINYSFHQNGEPFEEEELMDNSDKKYFKLSYFQRIFFFLSSSYFKCNF